MCVSSIRDVFFSDQGILCVVVIVVIVVVVQTSWVVYKQFQSNLCILLKRAPQKTKKGLRGGR